MSEGCNMKRRNPHAGRNLLSIHRVVLHIHKLASSSYSDKFTQGQGYAHTTEQLLSRLKMFLCIWPRGSLYTRRQNAI